MENYNESLIKQKQNLLTTEIIEKNYDKEKFVDFCLSKKENGDDLNNWTPEELVEIIKQFKDSTSILRDEASLPVTSLVSKEIVIDVDKLQICVRIF